MAQYISASLRLFMKVKKENLVQGSDFHRVFIELATEIAKATNPVYRY